MNRNDQYFSLNTKLSYSSDALICDKLEKGDLGKKGWGTNHIIKIGNTKVFAKKIPLTQVEFDNSFSTKNHYDLPMTYNYGIGSAGFGAFRELFLHIKTTNWVLSKKCLNFPLMYHYRIIKRTNKASKKDYKSYFKYWENNSSIKSYIKARDNSPYELVLFLEYIPQTFRDYLKKDKSQFAKITNEVLNAIQFLKSNNIIHMDMHFLNILTDGSSPYITDFGLGLDKTFDLSTEEKSFFSRHRNYDFGEFIGSMGLQLNGEFDDFSKRRKLKVAKLIDLSRNDSNLVKQEKIINNLSSLKKEGFFNLTPSYIKFIKDHQETILLTTKFFINVRNSTKREKEFSAIKLKSALLESKIIK